MERVFTTYVFVCLLAMCLCGVGETKIQRGGSYCNVPPPCACSGMNIYCDPTTVSNFTDYRFNMAAMTSWPTIFHVFGNLQTLYIDHINIQSLPYDAFRGFTTTLHNLSLTNTKFEHFPASIFNLKHLQRLIFSNNDHLIGDISLQNFCHSPLTEVTSIKLQNNKLSHFPEGIFNAFPNVTTLFLTNNNLRFIPYESIPVQNKLTYIDLSQNSFSAIPSGINNLPNLQTLMISFNNIHTIDRYDLLDLHHLTKLFSVGNPLENIDPLAFREQQTTLNFIVFDLTHFKTIPSAVTSLHNLTILSFPTSPPVECSCDTMAHLRNWNVSRVMIHGKCKLTDEPIRDYIMTSLPHCPGK